MKKRTQEQQLLLKQAKVAVKCKSRSTGRPNVPRTEVSSAMLT
jgi:hypothetical protein